MTLLTPRAWPTDTGTASPDILVVSRVFPPGAGGIEEYVLNRCLQDPGRVVVLTAAYPQAAAPDLPFPVYRWPVPAWLARLPLAGALKQLLYLGLSFGMALALYRRYRFRSIEWAHGYDFPVLLWLSYLLPVRCLLYLHGNDLLCPACNPLLRGLFRRTLARVETVVCNSRYTERTLAQHFPGIARTRVIEPGVRPGKFGDGPVDGPAVRLRWGIPSNAIVVLSVGRLVRRKGFERVIAQLNALSTAGVDAYYLICGRGPLLAELRAQAAALGVAERVVFAGYVGDADLASYYAAADLFALPTYYAAESRSIEGFGIVYLEAAYFGVPVLASRIGGVEDAVIDGETGILVDPDDDEALGCALVALCTDAELRRRLGENGRRRATRTTPHRVLYEPSV
jgi:phosphatidylinositol alpha-1,6-mannosyltransferase